jgi:hypothetical protein
MPWRTDAHHPANWPLFRQPVPAPTERRAYGIFRRRSDPLPRCLSHHVQRVTGGTSCSFFAGRNLSGLPPFDRGE